MLHLGIVKTFNNQTHKAGVQLVGSLTTYLDDIPVATNIAPEAMTVGNYVLVAIPGGNPRDACIVASWPAGSSGGGGAKIQDADGDTYLWVEKTADEDKIHGVVKGVEAFLLNDAGVLTLAKQTSAKGYLSGVQSVNNTTWTKVLYDAEEWDIHGDFDSTVNRRFDVAVTGMYLILCQACIMSMPAHSRTISWIKVNGTGKSSGRFTASYISDHECKAVLLTELTAGDYVEGFVYQDSGSAQTLRVSAGHPCNLVVHKIT